MKHKGATYHLCPSCGRGVHASAKETFCPNDGAKLLKACPACEEVIRLPYARYCTRCGSVLVARAEKAKEEVEQAGVPSVRAP